MTFISESARKPLLLVHGGAWAMPDAMRDRHEAGVRRAAETGYALLARGATAVEAVEAAVTVLEDDDVFDAGRGSFLTQDGRVQMDALLMEGATLRAGGVAGVEHLRNPIQAARLVLEQSPHVYFVGEGAERFAQEHGMERISNHELVVPRELANLDRARERHAAGLLDDTFSGEDRAMPDVPIQDRPIQDRLASHDTVGAVALDLDGNIAAGTSTGGTLMKAPGRVGDSSLIGCGCYADNLSAAVSLTGWGEPIMKLVLGKWAADRVEGGAPPQLAADQAIAYLDRRLGGHGGILVLDRHGRVGIAHNTPAMAWALASAAGVQAGITAQGEM